MRQGRGVIGRTVVHPRKQVEVQIDVRHMWSFLSVGGSSVPARYRCYGRFLHGSRVFFPLRTLFTALSQASGEPPPTRWLRASTAQSLRDVGQSLGVTPRAVRRARLQLLVFAPLFAGVIALWDYRHAVFDLRPCVQGTGRT